MVVIDWNEAIEQCGGDKDFLVEMLHELKNEILTNKPKLEIAVDKKDFKEIVEISHLMKGSSATLMCNCLAQNMADLERHAKSSLPCERKYENVVKCIERYFLFLSEDPRVN